MRDRVGLEIQAWLVDEINRRAGEIINGVDVERYLERVAEVRTLREMLDELPRAVQRAKDG